MMLVGGAAALASLGMAAFVLYAMFHEFFGF
jgi:hypothetical protein